MSSYIECYKSSSFTLLASKNLNQPTLASVHINTYFVLCTMYETEDFFFNKMKCFLPYQSDILACKVNDVRILAQQPKNY